MERGWVELIIPDWNGTLEKLKLPDGGRSIGFEAGGSLGAGFKSSWSLYLGLSRDEKFVNIHLSLDKWSSSSLGHELWVGFTAHIYGEGHRVISSMFINLL